MFSFKSIVMSLGLATAALLLAGTSTAIAAGPAAKSGCCDGCKLTSVRVTDTNSKGRVVGYHVIQKMTCPDCVSAIDNFLSTGKLEHACKACGGNMSMCD